MDSLRHLFLFCQPSNNRPTSTSSSTSSYYSASTVACSVAFAAGAGIAAGMAISKNPTNPFLQKALNYLSPNNNHNHNHNHSSPPPIWGSLCMSPSSSAITKPNIGDPFPLHLKGDSQRFLGYGVWKRSRDYSFQILKYEYCTFGVYADERQIKKFLSEKYGPPPFPNEVNKDLVESDICMTIRLHIVYGKLSNSSFAISVADRLQKFLGSDNKELLERFTSQFKDENKLPEGSIIEFSRDQGHMFRTTIDGKEVASIKSKLLCRSILDLYIGDHRLDPQFKLKLDSIRENE